MSIEDIDADALPEFWARWDGNHVVVRVPGPVNPGDDPCSVGVEHHLDKLTASRLFAQIGVALHKAEKDRDEQDPW